ncbi:MAG: tRNA (adenosine(37)-N6)-threonylcarbamoyltransferase complex dimerization subunit type 1 TsaB [Acidimicrobiales bacterium]|nr:tRNA (adenosine(37)-N6)-threonylcarbamoyltransferase complex dimerization subunit type 1 TsaB [Acidimicrobiales bacterium]MBO0894429.1 tRNA (adenosine(37)-N6)-threonylcarbamoyltransferase complex dimerization subunit type 1 TsaB [Acidimicrobiales bacterium]
MILGIETATPSVAVALGRSDGVAASLQVSGRPGSQRHAETLVPAIEFLCRQAGVALESLEAVAVDVGPGLFTGLRVGVATAEAMAQALQVGIVEGSSLELLAYPFRAWPGGLVASVVDARRSEVYYALFRPAGDHLEQLTPPVVGPPEELSSVLEHRPERCLAVGDGALRYASSLERQGKVELGGRDSAHPQATALVEMARPKVERHEVVRPGSVRVLYLRKADARVNYERREPVVAGPGVELGN